jgi:hypothetical protein
MLRPIVASSFLMLAFLLPTGWAQPSRDTGSLQSGLPISRTLNRGQSHRFTLALERDQFAKITVDQRGIDVVVRVYSPDGKSLGEFDSPNGANGPEIVPVVGVAPGTFSVEVAPLLRTDDVLPGSIEIRMTDLRGATSQELIAARSPEILKSKGIALLANLAEILQGIRVPQNRVRTQVQAAQLAWKPNEKLAREFLMDAMTGVREYMAKQDSLEPEYYQGYNTAIQMRQEVVQVLANIDPDLALTFLRATRIPSTPEIGVRVNSQDQELRMEFNLANQIAARDPKRAFQVAEEALTRGYSYDLTNIISLLRSSEPSMAAKLARATAAKLQTDKLLASPEASNLTVNLLRLAHSPAPRPAKPDGPAQADVALLSETEYRDLFMKALTESLAFTPEAGNPHSMEMNAARNLLNSLKSMTVEMRTIAPAGVVAAEAKLSELNATLNPQDRVRQSYQDAIYKEPLDVVLEGIRQAPVDMRDSLYQQVAQRAASMGDLIRARQIATDFIVNARQRQDALNNLERQAIQDAINKGRLDEAIYGIGRLRLPRDRANMISQLVGRLGSGVKKEAALNALEQVRRMLGASPRAEDQEQLNALLQTSIAFSAYDSKRAFDILEPIIDQFNDMGVAALALNGFGQQYFQDGELILQNGNPVANTASQLTQALGKLAVSDFERAHTDADKLRYPEVRAAAYLAIAQQAINPSPQKR